MVLFARVHDIRDLNIDLNAGEHPTSLPHPQTSSLLAYLQPAPYWHTTVEEWLERKIQRNRLERLLERKIQRLIRA